MGGKETEMLQIFNILLPREKKKSEFHIFQKCFKSTSLEILATAFSQNYCRKVQPSEKRLDLEAEALGYSSKLSISQLALWSGFPHL